MNANPKNAPENMPEDEWLIKQAAEVAFDLSRAETANKQAIEDYLANKADMGGGDEFWSLVKKLGTYEKAATDGDVVAFLGEIDGHLNGIRDAKETEQGPEQGSLEHILQHTVLPAPKRVASILKSIDKQPGGEYSKEVTYNYDLGTGSLECDFSVIVEKDKISFKFSPDSNYPPKGWGEYVSEIMRNVTALEEVSSVQDKREKKDYPNELIVSYVGESNAEETKLGLDAGESSPEDSGEVKEEEKVEKVESPKGEASKETVVSSKLDTSIESDSKWAEYMTTDGDGNYTIEVKGKANIKKCRIQDFFGPNGVLLNNGYDEATLEVEGGDSYIWDHKEGTWKNWNGERLKVYGEPLKLTYTMNRQDVVDYGDRQRRLQGESLDRQEAERVANNGLGLDDGSDIMNRDRDKIRPYGWPHIEGTIETTNLDEHIEAVKQMPRPYEVVQAAYSLMIQKEDGKQVNTGYEAFVKGYRLEVKKTDQAGNLIITFSGANIDSDQPLKEWLDYQESVNENLKRFGLLINKPSVKQPESHKLRGVSVTEVGFVSPGDALEWAENWEMPAPEQVVKDARGMITNNSTETKTYSKNTVLHGPTGEVNFSVVIGLNENGEAVITMTPPKESYQHITNWEMYKALVLNAIENSDLTMKGAPTQSSLSSRYTIDVSGEDIEETTPTPEEPKPTVAKKTNTKKKKSGTQGSKGGAPKQNTTTSPKVKQQPDTADADVKFDDLPPDVSIDKNEMVVDDFHAFLKDTHALAKKLESKVNNTRVTSKIKKPSDGKILELTQMRDELRDRINALGAAGTKDELETYKPNLQALRTMENKTTLLLEEIIVKLKDKEGAKEAREAAKEGVIELRWKKRQRVFDDLPEVTRAAKQEGINIHKNLNLPSGHVYAEKVENGVVVKRFVKLQGEGDQWYEIPYLAFYENAIEKNGGEHNEVKRDSEDWKNRYTAGALKLNAVDTLE